MPRGGRRPGAGAPKGNTNALKTGRHSVRVRAVIDALLADPETREVLLRLGSKGEVRNVYARELALAMARLMHERPIVEAKRALARDLGDAILARDIADDVNTEIAGFEQRLRRDAFTGDRLTRRPRRAPLHWQSIEHVKRRLGLTTPPPAPPNPPFTSAVDDMPYPLGPHGPVSDEEHARNLDAWERLRCAAPEGIEDDAS
jgi:hypothetical protein